MYELEECLAMYLRVNKITSPVSGFNPRKKKLMVIIYYTEATGFTQYKNDAQSAKHKECHGEYNYYKDRTFKD